MTAALERLRQAEATITEELAVVREVIGSVEATVAAQTPKQTLLTIVEAASELRVSRSRVFQLLAEGELESVRVGRARCVPRRSIDQFLDRLGAA